MSITAFPGGKFPALPWDGAETPGSVIYNRISGPVTALCQLGVSAWADTADADLMIARCRVAQGVEEIVKSRANQGIEVFVLIEFPSLRIMLAALLTAAVGMMTTVAAAGQALVSPVPHVWH